MQLGTNVGKAYFLKGKLNETAAHIVWRLVRNTLLREVLLYLCTAPTSRTPQNKLSKLPQCFPTRDSWQCRGRSVVSQWGWSVARSQGGVRPWQMHCPHCTHNPVPPVWEMSNTNRSSNLGLHSAVLVGIKFRIYNALDETERQLLFMTLGLAGVSVCHVAWLLTSSTEHTARK